jgi:hypothetical protein
LGDEHGGGDGCDAGIEIGIVKRAERSGSLAMRSATAASIAASCSSICFKRAVL